MSEPDEPRAFIGAATVYKIFKDGTLRLHVDVEPGYRNRVESSLGLQNDVPVAVTLISQEAAQQIAQQQMVESVSYGDEARTLKLSGFFLAPDVWRAVGSDAEYLGWLEHQPCSAATLMALDCSGDIVAAHVRRVAAGAGTGIKPQYSAISLCDGHHRIQHQQGESELAPRGWWESTAVSQVEHWCWETLKAQLGYESWKHVPPAVLCQWATKHGVERYLPGPYRGRA